jgi:hypothetical protein
MPKAKGRMGREKEKQDKDEDEDEDEGGYLDTDAATNAKLFREKRDLGRRRYLDT